MKIATDGKIDNEQIIVEGLLNKIRGDHWEFETSPEVEDTAYSAILLGKAADQSVQRTCVDYILNKQLENGSWNDSVEATWVCLVGLKAFGVEDTAASVKCARSYLETNSGLRYASVPVRSVVLTTYRGYDAIPSLALDKFTPETILSLDDSMSPVIFYSPALAFSLLAVSSSKEVVEACMTLLERNLSADGSYFGLTRSTVYGGLALKAIGRDGHFLATTSFLEKEMYRPREGFQSCKLSVWDTAWAMIALGRAGVAFPSRAIRWLIGAQKQSGGYSFTTGRRNVPPDLDTSSVVLFALATLCVEGESVDRLVRFLLEHQRADGSWATWSYSKRQDSSSSFRDLVAPFDEYADSDLEATAHAIIALCQAGWTDSKQVRLALDFLIRSQRSDGSWPTSSVAYPEYVTSQCVIALLRGAYNNQPSAARGIQFLLRGQQRNGSWLDDPERTSLALWALKEYQTPRSSIDAADRYLRHYCGPRPSKAVPYGKTWNKRNAVIDEGHAFFFPLIALTAEY